MGGAAAIIVGAHDLAGRIDRPGLRGQHARGIDEGEGALVPQKAPEVAAIGLVDAHDLAGHIDRPGAPCTSRPGDRWW